MPPLGSEPGRPCLKTDPLARDFRNLLYLIWKHLNLPDPTPIQYDIAKTLMSSSSRLAIQAFRGVGKSWVTAAYVIWELYRNPMAKIMVVSASKNRADNFTTFVLRLIHDIPELHHLRPKAHQRSSKVEFDVGPATPDQTPSVFSRGIDSQLTGGRADIIVSDDVEVPNNSMTAVARDQLQEKLKEYSAILKPHDPSVHGDFIPRIVYLGTPQTEDSIYGKLPDTFKTIVWPALVPTPEELPAYRGTLAPIVQEMFDSGLSGQPVDPARFDMDEIAQRRAEYGASGFQLQFMLNTRLSDDDRYPLKVRNLIIASVPPVKAPMEVFWLPNKDRLLKELPNLAMAGDEFYAPANFGNVFEEYRGKVLAIDPHGRGSDETGYAVGFQLSGNIWVPEAGGLPGGYDDLTLETLAKLAAKHKVNTVVHEGNFGDGMWGKLFWPVLQKYHRCELVEVSSKGGKEHRIVDTLEPVITGHRLIIDPEVIQKDYESTQKYEGEMKKAKSLVHQLTRIAKEKGALRKDDRIDALALLVGHFVEIMDQDSSKAAARAHEEHLKRVLEDFRRSAKHPTRPHGYPQGRPKWARI